MKLKIKKSFNQENQDSDNMSKQTTTKTFYNSPIPTDWEVTELGEIIEYKKGFAFKTDDYKESGIRIIRVSDTNADGIKTNGTIFLENSRAKNYLEWELKQNDIIIQTVGSRPPMYDSMVGKTILVNKEFEGSLLNQNAVRIRVKNGSNIFLFAHLKTKRYFDFIETLVRGNANQVSITLEDLFQFKLTLPPPTEQKAIAHILSLMDTTINKNNLLITKKELQKKWLMQNLLTGKMRLKGFHEEWEEIHLGEMFTERTETKYFDLPLLSVGTNGIYPQADSIKKDTSNEDKSKYKRICLGDIGYNTMRMWQGRSALSQLEGIVSPAYTIVTPKKNADSLFFSYLFKTPKLMNLFWRNSQGLVDDTLNCKYKDFEIVKVYLPKTGEEQTAIAQVLQAADKEMQLLKTKTEKLRLQKKGMMQVLLTGKKRLTINT